MNTGTMKNVWHKKKCSTGVVKLHVEPPPTSLIKSKHDDKLNKDFENIGLRKDPTSEKLDLHEFKIALFDNGDPEEICFWFLTSTWVLRRQELLRRPRRSNNFVRLFMEKRYVSFTCCLMTQKMVPH